MSEMLGASIIKNFEQSQSCDDILGLQVKGKVVLERDDCSRNSKYWFYCKEISKESCSLIASILLVIIIIT